MIIIEDRGKQYKVNIGDFLKLPKISDKKHKDKIIFSRIIFHKNSQGESLIGSPYIENMVVEASIVSQIKDKKIVVFKKKRRHNYRRKIGHRQDLTLLKINEIKVVDQSTSPEKDLSSSQKKVKLTKGESNGS